MLTASTNSGKQDRAFGNVLHSSAMQSLTVLNQRIASCTACPRLVTYREAVAKEKRRQYRDWIYWGRPVPGFGDPAARLYILGLAPAAHGGNRTGRIFTGDRSGDWLYDALYEFGFANQPTSRHKDDGLVLSDCYIGATVRCAPPDNKPAPEEFERCRPYVREELRLLKDLRVVVALGKIAFDHYLKACREEGCQLPSPLPRFGHGQWYRLPWGVILIGSYHPSQQNTFTGKLTKPMFHAVFARARNMIGKGSAAARPAPQAVVRPARQRP
ncbi:MAG TPA: uracil-DNA glycosylase [Nitrospiraceae bacterium]|nr:uracil-DNA glycosylase [Nitrospiraceae bacterium]